MPSKLSAEEFDRQLEARSDGPTRITLSEQRRFSGDSADGVDMRALQSKDAFFDYVSSSTPDAFGPGGPGGPPNMQGQQQPVHRQQQRLADEAMGGRASPYGQGRASPAPGSPYGMYERSGNGGMVGTPNGSNHSQQGYFPPQGQRQGPPPRQGSRDPYMDEDRNQRGGNKPTQTQQLAEFLRNTGPDQPFPSQQQQQQSQYDQHSRQSNEQQKPDAPPQKQKKRATGIFKGFGKKKNKEVEVTLQGGEGGPAGSGDKPKYVKLNVSYDPFKEPGGQAPGQESEQPSNREIRRSIIIAQDEGWFGAPLQHTSTGRQRRPESIIYEQTVAQARANGYVHPPGQNHMSFIQPPQQQQQMHYAPPDQRDQQQRPPPQQQHQQQYHPQDGPGNRDYAPPHQQPLRELPPEAIPPRHSFPYATQQMREAYLGGENVQNQGPGGKPSPEEEFGTRNDSRQTHAQPPPISSNAPPQQHQQHHDYVDDNEDWDDEDYDDEDAFSEMDEEVLRNTEMNAMIDLGLGDVMDPPKNKPSNRPQRNVVFNQVVEELVGAWEDSDGELDYGPLGVSQGSLRAEDDGQLDAPVAHRVSIAMSDGGDGPVIKSRGSSLIYATNKAGAPVPLPFGPPGSHTSLPPPPVSASPMPRDPGPPPPIAPRPDREQMRDREVQREREAPREREATRDFSPMPSSVDQAPMNEPKPARSSPSDLTPAPVAPPPPQSAPAVATKEASTDAAPAAQSSTPSSTTPPAPKARKKVRHVQIQTKGAAIKEDSCQTSPHLLPSIPPTPLPPNPDAAMEEALRQAEAEANNYRNESAHLRAENAALLNELASLRDGIASAQEERERMQWAMDDNKGKFDRLSAQAYKKIKELLVERQVMEIEIASLRGQLDSLEVQQRAWMEMEEEGLYGDVPPSGHQGQGHQGQMHPGQGHHSAAV
ncbi:hypothetical protein HK097_007390 [Rhizophlyctis rosea]|uniref:Uncharacterized protein n=1 Tax=Rhizophlyctis rosea TaxID=64517 RepID=A0AAD5SJL7_9FUNG|nr:hypothetical protein HK097_007390 [Rhizophlyctis rosea]